MKRCALFLLVLLVPSVLFGAATYIDADFQDGVASPSIVTRVGDTRDIKVRCYQNGTNWALGAGYTAKLKWFFDLDDTNTYSMTGSISSNLVTFDPAANFWAFPVDGWMFGIELSAVGEQVQPAIGSLTVKKSTFDITNEFTLANVIDEVPQPTNGWSEGDYLTSSDGGTTTYSFTISGITDLGATNVSGSGGLYLSYTSGNRTVYGHIVGGELTDINAGGLTGSVPASSVSESSVTQHEDAITIASTQISDFTSGVHSAELDTIATNALDAWKTDASNQFVNIGSDKTNDAIASEADVTNAVDDTYLRLDGSRAMTGSLTINALGGLRIDSTSDEIAVGNSATATVSGIAIGNSANATQDGIAIGEGTLVNKQSIGIGFEAQASEPTAPGDNIAIGYRASAPGSQRVAIGMYASNAINGTTLLRNHLYLDGATNIMYRQTHGSGAWIAGPLQLGTSIEGNEITDGTISNADLSANIDADTFGGQGTNYWLNLANATGTVPVGSVSAGAVTQHEGSVTIGHEQVSDWTSAVRSAENDTTATNYLVSNYQTSADATNKYVDEAGDFMDGDLWVTDTNSVGSEIISNGTFTGSANWWETDTATYQANKLVINDSLSPTLTPTGNMTVVEGKTYTFSYNVAQTNMDVQLSVGGRTNKQYAHLGDFTWTFSAIEDTDPVINLTTTNGQSYFDDVTMKENTNGNLVVGRDGYVGGDLRVGGTVYGALDPSDLHSATSFVKKTGDTMTGSLSFDGGGSINDIATISGNAGGEIDLEKEITIGQQNLKLDAVNFDGGGQFVTNVTLGGGVDLSGGTNLAYTSFSATNSPTADNQIPAYNTNDSTWGFVEGGSAGTFTNISVGTSNYTEAVTFAYDPVYFDKSFTGSIFNLTLTNSPPASSTNSLTEVTVTDGTTSSNYNATLTLAFNGPAGTVTGAVYNLDFSRYATGTPIYVDDDSAYATGTPLYVESYTGTLTTNDFTGENVAWTSSGGVMNAYVDLSSYATGAPLYVYGETNTVEGGTGATVTQTGGVFNIAVDLGADIASNEVDWTSAPFDELADGDDDTTYTASDFPDTSGVAQVIAIDANAGGGTATNFGGIGIAGNIATQILTSATGADSNDLHLATSAWTMRQAADNGWDNAGEIDNDLRWSSFALGGGYVQSTGGSAADHLEQVADYLGGFSGITGIAFSNEALDAVIYYPPSKPSPAASNIIIRASYIIPGGCGNTTNRIMHRLLGYDADGNRGESGDYRAYAITNNAEHATQVIVTNSTDGNKMVWNLLLKRDGRSAQGDNCPSNIYLIGFEYKWRR